MAKNIGIITSGNVVIEGDVNVTGDDKPSKDTNVGIVTAGDSNVVVNGAFNVGGAAGRNGEPQ